MLKMININTERQYTSMKNAGTLVVLLMVISLFFGNAFAQTTLVECINNQTAELNISILTVTEGTPVTVSTREIIRCPYGCDNSTGGSNDCRPDPSSANLITFVPAFVLFILAFLFIYIAIHMKQYQALQFLFFGLAMFFMITNAWFAFNQASLLFRSSISDVFINIYQIMIVATVIVIFYFILNVLREAWRNAERRRHGIWSEREEA
jgi:hypothetical protein